MAKPDLQQAKQLMDDRTAWNKVFRRSFWDQHKLAFPEGVLYEDTPVIVPAHVLATARTQADAWLAERRGKVQLKLSSRLTSSPRRISS